MAAAPFSGRLDRASVWPEKKKIPALPEWKAPGFSLKQPFGPAPGHVSGETVADATLSLIAGPHLRGRHVTSQRSTAGLLAYGSSY
jgi:hypothetical protein